LVDEIAKRNGTINYEILCAIGQRVPRVYYSGNKIVKITDLILKTDGEYEE
jgi:alanine racemase